MYNDEFRIEQGGKVGITCNEDFRTPRNKYREFDYDSATRNIEFHLGWWAEPIFVSGDYPEVMKVIDFLTFAILFY